MFVFCYVFSQLIFGQELENDVSLGFYVPLGAGVNTVSALVVGLTFAIYSDCAISIAGPDINPTVFLAQIALDISNDISSDYPSLNPHSPEYTTILLSTILVSIIISTAILGVWFYILGGFHLTKVLQFVPAAVLSGFLAAVGVIVMLKAVKQAAGDSLYHYPSYWEFWVLLAPALPIGFVLYFSKRFHLGSPILTIPLCLFGPFLLFYVVVYASGNSLETLRDPANSLCYQRNDSHLECSWIYPEYARIPLVDQWRFSYGSLSQVHWASIAKSLPTLIIMIFVVTLDVLLKMGGTKKVLKVQQLEYDHEMQLAGRANIFVVFLAGAPAYAQLKFNVLNYGIIENTSSRFPGIVSATFNGILFFSGWPMIDFLPRFFVAGLLVFAGMGFIVENLVDTWIENRLSTFEYLIVICIVVISQVGGSNGMLIAVCAGIVASSLFFAFQYGSSGVVKSVISGRDYQSSVVRSEQEEAKVEHLCSQCIIIRLHRHIFFGSASQVTELVKSILSVDGQFEGIDHERINTIVFDFEEVERIDFSGVSAFGQMITGLVSTDPPNPNHTSHQLTSRMRNSRQRNSKASHQTVSQEEADSSKLKECGSNLKQMLKRRKTATQKTAYRVLISGLSPKIYSMFLKEGILDMIHRIPGQDSPILAPIRSKPRLGYIRGLFKRPAAAGTSLHDKSHIDSHIDGAVNLQIVDYYLTPDIPLKDRRIFHNLDFAMECVEELFLEKACEVRMRWLQFSSAFKRLHDQARLKATHEPFEHILKGHLGDSIWKYIQTFKVPKGWFLCRHGRINPHLYLLQQGKLSSYMHRADGLDIRVQTLRRGAFVNEDALFIEMPISHSIVADEDSIVLALSRESLKNLEAHQPEVAFEIHRNVLKHIARTRNKLARELDGVSTVKLSQPCTNLEEYEDHEELQVPLHVTTTTTIASERTAVAGKNHLSSVSRKMGDAVDAAVEALNRDDSITCEEENAPISRAVSTNSPGVDLNPISRTFSTRSPRMDLNPLASISPSLIQGIKSSTQTMPNRGARPHDNNLNLAEFSQSAQSRHSKRGFVFRRDLAYHKHMKLPEVDSPHLTGEQMESVRANIRIAQTMKRDAVARFKSAIEQHKEIDLIPVLGNLFVQDEILQVDAIVNILMDMGHFPSLHELNRIMFEIKQQGPCVIDEATFLRVIKELSIEHLTDQQIQGFARLFQEHAVTLEDSRDHLFHVFPGRVVTTSALYNILVKVDQDQDRYTLERHVRDWQRVSNKPIVVGEELALSFVSFCSMMAKHLKDDALDQQVEEDYVRLISADEDIMPEESIGEDGLVTAECILCAMPNLRLEQAEEMIFEADISGRGGVSYLDLVETLTNVFDSEIIGAEEIVLGENLQTQTIETIE